MSKKLPWFFVLVIIAAWFIAVNITNPVEIIFFFPFFKKEVPIFYGLIVAFSLGVLVTALFTLSFGKKSREKSTKNSSPGAAAGGTKP
ncbi:MAG: hypothetical protein LBS64_03860 [Spirochaetaceae bacterium]|jgi:uncharacterized integral membrane protein|nr:hypothetical protein [Spirochaetaceae bacterium]